MAFPLLSIRLESTAMVGISACLWLSAPLLMADDLRDHEHDPDAAHESEEPSAEAAPSIASDRGLPDRLRGMSIDFGESSEADTSIGGFLFPELFVQGVFGDSTTDPSNLAVGDHDPNSDAMLQSLYFALEMEVGDILSGFVNYDGTTDASGHYSGELEEGFIHVRTLPWLSIGGGQFLNRFGFHNQRHVHAWDFVDQYLVSGRMLNEGALTTQGGELIFILPTSWESTLTIGGGGVRDNGRGDRHPRGRDHGDSESAFKAEGADFDNWVVTGNYRADYGRHENMAGTVSGAIGENGFGEITQVYGIGHEIVWNPEKPLYNDEKTTVLGTYRGGSFGPGSLRWRSELMYRNVGAFSARRHHGEEEDGHGDKGPDHASLDEFGLYTQLQYGFTDLTTASLRGEWVSGIDGFGLEERWRVSPSIGVYLTAARRVHLRLQYNYDHSRDFGEEHSVWLQFGFAWGSPSHHDRHYH